MDWSPILISMKTASLSIFITFFIGLFVAWAVVSLKNETLKVICDGILTLPLVLPPTVAGFFLLYLFGVKRPIGQFFIEYFCIKKSCRLTFCCQPDSELFIPRMPFPAF